MGGSLLHGLLTIPNVVLLGKGILVTVSLSLVGMVGGLVIGGAVGLIRTINIRLFTVIDPICILYTEAFRRVPLLVVLLLSYFGLAFFGINVSNFLVASVGVIAYAGAYIGENVRAGIESVKRQQWDAAAALGMDLGQQLRYIILPQAIRVIIPPSIGFFIALVKDTSLATIVGLVEITQAGVILRYQTGRSFMVFLLILLIYFVICYPLSRISQVAERRLRTRWGTRS